MTGLWTGVSGLWGGLSGLLGGTALSTPPGLLADIFFTPASLFGGGEQGAWYDPSNINLNWRTNLLLWSEDFSNAAWNKVEATISANSTTAPDGTVTADTLTPSTNSAGHFVYQTFSSVSAASASVYAKANGYRWLRISVTGIGSAFFDLQTGVVGTVDAGLTAQITSVANGFYRCSAYFSATATRVNYLVEPSNGNTSAWSGDGTSGIYIWGAQVALGTSPGTYQKITDGIQDYFTYYPQPTMFQDSAGTTPASAVEQPVGLILDESKNLTIGPELIDNPGPFASTTGWSAFATSGTAPALSVVSSKLRITYGTTYTFGAAVASFATVVGSWYTVVVTASFVSGTDSGLYIQKSDQDVGSLNPVGTSANAGVARTMRLTFPATATTTYLRIINSGTPNATYDVSIASVKSIAGNHAYQSTSTSRPTLSARVNLLTYSEQFDNAVWANTGVTVAANNTASPTGTTTADKLTATAADSFLRQSIGVISGLSYDFSVWLRADAPTTISIYCLNPITPQVCNVTTTWQRFTLTVSPGITGSVGWQIGGGSSFSTGEIVYAWGADLRPSNQSNLLPYQRIAAATDYDTNGFPIYLKFDGTDDWLSTATISPIGVDKAQVFAGVRKLSDANQGIIAEMSAAVSSNAGSLNLSYAEPSGTANYSVRARGSAVAPSVIVAGYAAPITNVLTITDDISGDALMLRANGVQVGTNTADQGTGNFLSYPLYIGRRGGTTLPFNGNLYGLIVRFSSVNLGPAPVANTEQWMAAKCGISFASVGADFSDPQNSQYIPVLFAGF